MRPPITVTEAIRDGLLIRLTFSDNTKSAIYPEGMLPRCYSHDLLDDWLAEGNEIKEPE